VRKKWWIALIVIVVVAAAVVGGGILRQRQMQAANVALEPGDIVTVSIGNLLSGASAGGRLEPRLQAQVALATAGRVAEVAVQAGDRVQAGDMLVQLERDDLERAVRQAENDLAIQEANLAELLQAPDAGDVAARRAAVEDAQAALDDLLAGPSKEERAQAEAALVSAQAALDDLLAGADPQEVALARANLASAQANLEAARVRNAALNDQILGAQTDIHNAQLAIDRASDAYDQLVWNDWKAGVSWAPYSPQGVALEKAKINYEAAVANLRLTELDVNDSALRSAEAQVAQAQASLTALTEEKTVQIVNARAQVARAEKNLALLLDDQTVQIAAARAQLAQAQANLDSLLEGPTDGRVAMAQAQVELARIALEDAQAKLDDATLVAPFDGLVTDVYVSIGEQASGAAVELVHTDSMQVVLDVDEVDIGRIAKGQHTIVSLQAWPGVEFSGQVASIAPQATNQVGIVSYQVRVDVDWRAPSAVDGAAASVPLLTGMTADADLITAEREDVLLVPNRAIVADRQAGTYYVYRLNGEEREKVEITIGLRDNAYTEVVSGLQEGDRLVIAAIAEPTPEPQFGSNPHGGFGGPR
jgi:HlyD family secretion protein